MYTYTLRPMNEESIAHEKSIIFDFFCMYIYICFSDVLYMLPFFFFSSPKKIKARIFFFSRGQKMFYCPSIHFFSEEKKML